MENSKLQKMLKANKLWIDSNKKQGEPANICEANFYGADFCKADIRGSDIRGSNLCEANLYFFWQEFHVKEEEK